MTDAKGNGTASPANFHDDTDEETVEVSVEAAAVAAQELGFTIERTGGPETSAQEACSPLAAVRQEVADNDDLDLYTRGFVLSTIDRIGEERNVKTSNADPLTCRIFDARREFEQALEDGNPSANATGRITFSDDLVASVVNGTKTATVRYDGFEDVSPGDRLTAATEDGSPFTHLEVRRTATVDAVEVHDLLDLFGAEYPSETPQDVIDALNEHYDTTIGPATSVRALVFEVIQDA